MVCIQTLEIWLERVTGMFINWLGFIVRKYLRGFDDITGLPIQTSLFLQGSIETSTSASGSCLTYSPTWILFMVRPWSVKSRSEVMENGTFKWTWRLFFSSITLCSVVLLSRSIQALMTAPLAFNPVWNAASIVGEAPWWPFFLSFYSIFAHIMLRSRFIHH